MTFALALAILLPPLIFGALVAGWPVFWLVWFVIVIFPLSVMFARYPHRKSVVKRVRG